MTREELINIIYNSGDKSICQKVNCRLDPVEDSCLECAEKLLTDYDKHVISDFAQWLTQKIDLRFSSNPYTWVDEYFNHTSEKLLERLKGQYGN